MKKCFSERPAQCDKKKSYGDDEPLIPTPTTPEEATPEEKELPWLWRADDQEPQPRTPDVDRKTYYQRATSSKYTEQPRERSVWSQSHSSRRIETSQSEEEKDLKKRIREWKATVQMDRKIASEGFSCVMKEVVEEKGQAAQRSERAATSSGGEQSQDGLISMKEERFPKKR